MANWFTKALNKVGSAVTGNSDYNVWHDINKVGAGVGGFLKGSVASIPNSIAGAATGALTGMAGGPVGAIAGAITGAVASGAPVVLQGVVAEVNSYDAEHGYELAMRSLPGLPELWRTLPMLPEAMSRGSGLWFLQRILAVCPALAVAWS